MNIDLRLRTGLVWPDIGSFLRVIWERQSVPVCMGIITIATASIMGAFVVLNTATSGDSQHIPGSQRLPGGIDIVGLPPLNPSMQGQEVYNIRVWVPEPRPQPIWSRYWDKAPFLLFFGAIATYFLLLVRVGQAIFNTDWELVTQGMDRRRAVRAAYRLFLSQHCFILASMVIVVMGRWW